MNKKLFDIPVLFITFNKPETTCHVFEQIRKLKPETLYIFSDAARENNTEDTELVETCRYLFDDSQINWKCKVERWYSDVNMGSARGVFSAISWAFEKSEQLIILEDDCLPHPTFFPYCKTMLSRYADNDRVMHISGTCWNEGFKREQADHFFSVLGSIWGWATWKRAWLKYDFWMEQLPEFKASNKLMHIFEDRDAAEFWEQRLDEVHEQEEKLSWKYQWQYTLFVHYGLATVPNVNLISNIGTNTAENDELNGGNFSQTFSWKNQVSNVNLSIDKDYDKYLPFKRLIKKQPIHVRALKSVQKLFSV